MTRSETPIVRHRELIFIDGEVVGPKGPKSVRLVLDTGAAATTLVPEVIEEIGYGAHHGHKQALVHTAVGDEKGYWLRVSELSLLGVTTADFAVTVFPLGHQHIDGLLGMNFLRHFNFEVRPRESRILAELIEA